MKTNIKTEISTQLGIFYIPKVLINLVIGYLDEPLPLTKEERQSLAAFLLKIFADLSIKSIFENRTRNPEWCETAFFQWIPILLTAISEGKPVEKKSTAQNLSMHGIAQDLLKQSYYIDPEEALYDLLNYAHGICSHAQEVLLNFIFVDILTKAKLIDSMQGHSFCIALHELAGIYRFNITKNMAAALYQEMLDTSVKPEDEKDQLRSCKKNYKQLGFDCRYLTHNGENGYLTLFPLHSIRRALTLESKHLPITTSDPIPDLDSKKDNMIQALRNFIKLNSGFHFFNRDVIKTQIGKCNFLIKMLETLDLNKNIAVQTILSQVSVYKDNEKANPFQTTLEIVFKGMLSLSNQCISRLPGEPGLSGS